MAICHGIIDIDTCTIMKRSMVIWAGHIENVFSVQIDNSVITATLFIDNEERIDWSTCNRMAAIGNVRLRSYAVCLPLNSRLILGGGPESLPGGDLWNVALSELLLAWVSPEGTGRSSDAHWSGKYLTHPRSSQISTSASFMVKFSGFEVPNDARKSKTKMFEERNGYIRGTAIAIERDEC